MKRKSLLIMLLMAMFAPLAMHAQQALPYTYGFENNDLSADGWTAQTTSSNSGIYNSSSYAHSGSYLFRFAYSEQNAYLVSPLLSGTENGVSVSFYYSEYSATYGDEQFYVGYTTDENVTEPSEFTYGDIVTASTEWTEYGYTFPNGTKRIAIKYVYNDAYYLFLDDFTFEVPASCPKPTGLAYTTSGTEATVTWTSDADAWQICLNEDESNLIDVNEPTYTFRGLVLNATYTVKVRTNCGSEFSVWTDAISFTTDYCLAEDMCEIEVTLTTNSGYETYGWYGSYILVYDNDSNEIIAALTESSGTGTTAGTLPVCDGRNLRFEWYSANANNDQILIGSYSLIAPDGTVIAEGTGPMTLSTTYTMVCPSCGRPTNLSADKISTNSALLSWEGNNDNYILQYRTAAQDMNLSVWNQSGNDQAATGTMTTYTYDLSDFSGTGSVAIRHYNVSDMFRLIVDDIVITNAAGTTVLSENFERSDGEMPADWDLIDLDGDGFNWDVVSSEQSYVNGSYGLSSASWTSSTGALTPDNWVIIPNVELGGTLTFAARGQDANYPAENFGVFVTTESYEGVPAGRWMEVETRENSYLLENLTANTPYEWQVKGFCGGEESGWSNMASFTTDPEGFKTFITNGNWDDDANWSPAGVPTFEDEVSIEADAIIRAGVVAQAKRATINGGSITIKDGGQLKQGAATLKVTMEKEITGYGESTGKDHYYFIASPFSGRTKLSYDAGWSHVLNVTDGDYDLYAFDPTAEDGLEWINYESSPSHIYFQAENNGNPGLLYGEGYLYANKVNKTLEFTGVTLSSYNNVMTNEYTYNEESTDDFNGWRLVGNPFSCNAYINYIDGENVLEADFYTMNANGNGYELSSSNVGLAPLTGAFINYSANGTIQYASEGSTSKRTGMLDMNLNCGSNAVDQARIRFGEGYNLKHMSFQNSSKLYMPVDGNDYAVVYTESQGEMPVSFKAESNGTYTLSFNTENVEFGYLHLIDNMTGNDVDLLSNPSYTFEAKSTDYANRFKLVFATGNADDNFAFYSNGSFVINNEGIANIQVMDVNGRIISSESINGCANLNVNAAPGVYMLRLVNGDNVKVQKVVVR